MWILGTALGCLIAASVWLALPGVDFQGKVVVIIAAVVFVEFVGSLAIINIPGALRKREPR